MKPSRKKQPARKKSRAKAQPAARKHGELKSLDELAKEQGITGPPRWEDLIGAGKDLWKSDEEFDEFLNGIYERRQRGR